MSIQFAKKISCYRNQSVTANVWECEDLSTCMDNGENEINKKYHGQMPNDINHQIWQELNDLPSVQPIRPKGEWEYINDGIFTKIKCECGYEQVVVDGFADNYCPNCGAEMTESDGQA